MKKRTLIFIGILFTFFYPLKGQEKTVQELLKELEHSSSEFKIKAIFQLANFTSKAEEIVPKLILTLKDENPKVKHFALLALWNFKEQAEPALPILLVLLKDEDFAVKKSAIWAIKAIGEKAEPAIPALISLLEEEQPLVQWLASIALESIGEKSVPFLIQLLKKRKTKGLEMGIKTLGRLGKKAEAAISALKITLKNSNIAKTSANALAEMGTESAINVLIETLEEEESTSLQIHLTRALGSLGGKAEPAIPALIKALKSEDSYVRRNAARALGKIGAKAAPAVPFLKKLLKDRSSAAKNEAAIALGKIGKEAASAIPLFLRTITSGALYNRNKVNHAFMRIVKSSGQGIDLLLKEFKQGKLSGSRIWEIREKLQTAQVLEILLSSKKNSRKMAVQILGQIGENDTKVIAKLLEILETDLLEIKLKALKAIIKISPKETLVPLLLKFLEGNEIEIVRQSAIELINLGEKSEQVLHCLIECIKKGNKSGKNRSSRFRIEEEEALKKIGPKAIPALIAMLKSKSSSDQSVAAIVLGELKAEEAIPELLEAFQYNHPDPERKINRISYETTILEKALNKIGSKTIPYLINVLNDDNLGIIISSIRVLGKFGKEAQPSIPMLQQHFKDSRPAVRYEVLNSLSNLEIDADEIFLTFLKGLNDPNQDVIRSAVKALGKMKKRHKVVLPLLLELFQDENDDLLTKQDILSTFSDFEENMESTLPAVFAYFEERIEKSKKEKVPNKYPFRYLIARALTGLDEKSLPHLARFFEKENLEVKRLVITLLGNLLNKTEGAFSLLKKIYDTGDDTIKIWVLQSISIEGKIKEEILLFIKNAVKEDNLKLRNAARNILGNLVDEQLEQALDEIISGLKEEEQSAKNSTLYTLKKMELKAEPALPELIRRIKDGDNNILNILENLGQKSILAVPAICEIQHKSKNFDKKAAFTLSKLGITSAVDVAVILESFGNLWRNDPNLTDACKNLGSEIIPDLIHILIWESPAGSRIAAAEALGKMGEKAYPAIPILIEILYEHYETYQRNWNPQLRIAVIEALGKIGIKGVSPLLELIEHREREIRWSAMKTLGKIGPPAKKAIPFLKEQLNSTNEGNRFWVAWSLFQIDPTIKEAFQILKQNGEDRDSKWHLAAIIALGEKEKAIEVVLPALINFLAELKEKNFRYPRENTSSFFINKKLVNKAIFLIGESGTKSEKAISLLEQVSNRYPYQVSALKALQKIQGK